MEESQRGEVMNNPLISIIIPVYNVEPYLQQCVDSVLKQSYKNIEVFLVDDGSKDRSPELCDKYAQQDARIKVIHKENGGQGDARNKALDIAEGEYITFVDSDDYLDDNYVQYLFDLLQHNNADISICETYVFFDDKIKQDYNTNESIEVMSSFEALKRLLLKKGLIAAPWCKMYRKEVFKDVRYPGGCYYEDLAVIHKLFLNSKSVVVSQKKTYFYRQRQNSTMNCEFNIRKMDRVRIAEDIKKDVMKTHPEFREELLVRCFIANIQTLRELPNGKEYTHYRKIIEDNIKKYRKATILCKDAKATIKGMALVSYLGIPVLKLAGNIYSAVYK